MTRALSSDNAHCFALMGSFRLAEASVNKAILIYTYDDVFWLGPDIEEYHPLI